MIKSPISWKRMSYSNIHAFKAKLVTSTMQEWWQMHVYPGGMSQKDHNVCDSVASLAFAERWFSAREREREPSIIKVTSVLIFTQIAFMQSFWAWLIKLCLLNSPYHQRTYPNVLKPKIFLHTTKHLMILSFDFKTHSEWNDSWEWRTHTRMKTALV